MSDASNLDRRGFFKTAAAAATAGAGALATAPAIAATLPASWDRETDVVVLGAGGAGLMAAVQAHDGGARVVLFDKGHSPYHSATRMCGGLFTAYGTKIQKAQNVKDSAEQFAKDVLAYGGYMNFPGIVRMWTARSGEVFDWIADRGLAEHRLETYGGHTNLRAVRQASYTGKDYIDVLWKEFQQRRIPIEFGTPLSAFYYDDRAGRVAGVQVTTPDGQRLVIRARRGVILATGGITGSAERLDKWVPAVAGAGVAIGGDANDGGALMIAVRDLGVPLSHMQFIASYPWGVVTRGRNGVACRYLYFVAAGGILVNKLGKRFISEETGMTKVSPELPKQPESVHFLLVDGQGWDETLKKYAIGALFSMPAWSMERVNEELARGKVLFRGDTLDDVARKAGIPAQDLAETLKIYNKAVEAQNDAQFKRQKLPRQMTGGPFYMVRMSFWNNLSLGGVRVDGECRVLGSDDKPVAGFYAAGETVAGVHGATYCGGNAISWCHTSGYVAGQRIVAHAA